MDKFIKASGIQRDGLKNVYKAIENYQEAFIINQINEKIIKMRDMLSRSYETLPLKPW